MYIGEECPKYCKGMTKLISILKHVRHGHGVKGQEAILDRITSKDILDRRTCQLKPRLYICGTRDIVMYMGYLNPDRYILRVRIARQILSISLIKLLESRRSHLIRNL